MKEHLENIAFINLDMTYHPIKYVLKTLIKYNRLQEGSIICIQQAIRPEAYGIIYDSNYRGAIEAFTEGNIEFEPIFCADVHIAFKITKVLNNTE